MPSVTPVPKLLIGTACCFMFFQAWKAMMVLSFLPEFVKSFGTSEVDAGKQAGLVASSIFISSVPFSFVWGYLGDVKGHTFIMLFSQTGLMVSSLLFGFSFNIYWAFFSRLLLGCFLGIASSAKCIIYESCDQTNLALGMSLLATAVSAGFLIGPSFTGLLVFPGRQYPGSFNKDNFFARFGILLPILIMFVVDIFVLALGIKIFPKYYKRKPKSIPLVPLATKKTSIHSDSHEKEDLITPNTTTKTSLKTKIKSSRFMRLLRDKYCVIMFTLYGFVNLIDGGLNILFPLYVATHRDLNGLGFMPKDISFVLLGVVVIIIFLQIVVYPKLINKYGSKTIFIGGFVGISIFFPLLPTIKYITNIYALYITAYFHLLICRASISIAFLAANILLSNSVPADLLGLINGVGVGTASIGRLGAPLLFGNLFSWSLTNIKTMDENSLGFPFNEYFTFFLVSLLGLMSAAAAYFFIPLSFNNKSQSLIREMVDELEHQENDTSGDDNWITTKNV